VRVQFDSLRSKILAAVVEAKSVVVESGGTFISNDVKGRKERQLARREKECWSEENICITGARRIHIC